MSDWPEWAKVLILVGGWVFWARVGWTLRKDFDNKAQDREGDASS
jgi:hypothetical protein